ERRDEPDRSRPRAYPRHHLGDGVHGVVVARTTEVGQAAGDGERARIVGRDAESLAPDLHCRGKAAVDVEVVYAVDADAGGGEGSAARLTDRGGAHVVHPGRYEPAVGRLSAPPGGHPTRLPAAERPR